ncbi:hypothetical protein TNCV_4046761 [Trichonephila clavipes]|nr:hypothetical protein TNCV_4046761 [Trichonephila clavipes]
MVSEKNCVLFFFPIAETQEESVPEPNEIGNVIEEVVDLARQMNLEVDCDDIKKLLRSHNWELTMDELKKCMNIEEFESLDPLQSEDGMTMLGI